jgi:transglutaminase-like putative cysteine protease
MRYILLIFLFLFPVTILAQHKNFSVTPSPSWLIPYHPDLSKKPDPRDVSDGYYVLLYEEQNNAEQHAIYHHRIRQIVSEAGIQNGSEISAVYDPVYEKLKFHQVIIHRNGQIINKLQPAHFKFLQQEEELSRFIYSGLYNAYFILEDVRKGDQIEYSYTIEGNNPVFENKYSSTFYLGFPDPIVNYYQNIIASPSREIRFKAFNNAPLPGNQLLNGMKVYEWKFTDLKPIKSKKNVPSWYSSYPIVQASEYKDWKEVIDWACHINTTGPPGTSLKARIAELKKETGDNKELYLQKAIRFVQDDIRYMGIEMGEYSHRPNTPDRILAQRFGDCKDKSLLLVTLLNANGIPASMAYINTYKKQYTADYLPAPDLFNHAIVYTTFNGKGVWIDPTISYQRGNIKRLTIPDYGKGLILTPGKAGFDTVANTGTGSIKITERFTLPYNTSDTGILKVTSVFTGDEADEIRNTLASSSLKEEEQGYLDFYRKIYGSLTADSAMEINDVDSTNTLTTIEKYSLQQTWKVDSTNARQVTFWSRARTVQQALPAYPDENKQDAPLALNYPYKLDYTMLLQMPQDWPFNDPDLHIKNPYYKFDFKVTTNGRFITLHYHYETYQDNIPLAYMATYIKERDQIDEVFSFRFYWASHDDVEPEEPEAPQAPATPSSLNWLAIGLAMFAAALFCYPAFDLYKKSLLPVQTSLTWLPINSWLILLAIGVVVRPFLFTISLISTKVFTSQYWYALHRQPNATGDISVLQLMISVEVIFNVFFIVYSVVLTFLFFKRRDSFPIAMIYFLLINLVYTFLDMVVRHFILKHVEVDPDTLRELLTTFVSGGIWSLYLLKSEQVKETFIMPYEAEE